MMASQIESVRRVFCILLHDCAPSLHVVAKRSSSVGLLNTGRSSVSSKTDLETN